jgi:predicted DNA-binding helix-hairpin-helix protein
MDEIAKLRMACQGCDQEVSDDREIPAVVHHPDLTIKTSSPVKPPLPIPQHKLEDMEIFHAQMGGGKTIPLLKTMLTTFCENNCNYCAFRRDRDFQRVGFSPDEMAGLFMKVFRKGLVKGLFLSSGIAGSAVRSQDRLLDCVSILRKKYGFRGYIHLKLLPGVQDAQIAASLKLADRVSINIEGPNETVLTKLAPQKKFADDLIGGLDSIHRITDEEQGKMEPTQKRTSLTTQLVMGAVGESDSEILQTTHYLYSKLKLARVYYSAFSPTPRTPFDSLPPLPHLRHARMYQASFLLRDYAFDFEELPFQQDGNLRTEFDPKLAWAKENLEGRPVDIAKADIEQLMRIPGIGRINASRILEERVKPGIRNGQDLVRMGVSMKRCAPFILIHGKQPEYQPELIAYP